MAYEEIAELIKAILMLGAFLLPALYLLDIIRDRLRQKSKIKDIVLLYVISCLIVVALLPFFLPYDVLFFQSAESTYVVALLFLFLVYLIVFNKTKE